jgi:hypothetical protein
LLLPAGDGTRVHASLCDGAAALPWLEKETLISAELLRMMSPAPCWPNGGGRGGGDDEVSTAAVG